MAYSPGQDIVVHPGAEVLTDGEVRRLQALQAFNAKLVCMTVDESSYEEVVRGVHRVLGYDACALFLQDRQGDHLVLKAAVGYPGIEPGLRIACDDPTSAHAQAFSEEYLVNIDDLFTAGGCKTLDGEFGSNLIMPISGNHGPVGVFDFGSRQPGTFDQREISMCSMLVDQMAFSLENLRLVGELSSSRDAVIRGMALLAEIRDSHIKGHLDRICAYSRYLAESIQDRPGYREVSPAFIEMITRAAALHDVGKVGIPDAILLKPGKLTAEEFEVMRSHATVGSDLLEGLMHDYGHYGMILMGKEVARHHHEWWDGNGYPDGISGTEIPLAARIVAIADVYDALTSKRVYKEAWNFEETASEMRAKSGSQFDPELLEIFLQWPRNLEKIRRTYPD